MLMARVIRYSFYKHKATGQWVAGGIGENIQLSPKMCDVKLWVGHSNTDFPSSVYKREWVDIRKFTPPRVTAKTTRTAKKKVSKKARKAKEKAE